MHVRSSVVNNYNDVKIKPPTSLALHHLLISHHNDRGELTCMGKKLSSQEPLSNEKLEDTPDQISLFTDHAVLCMYS